jgi:NAD(P)-dependent dehydrogenase (short-subunit alcohol dehydrogenase family)
MTSKPKTAIVTGASQGIGAGIVKTFIERGVNVVANSRKVSEFTDVAVHQIKKKQFDVSALSAPQT